MNDTVGDMLTRIRNAQKVFKISVRIKHNKVCIQVLNILRKEGYINGYKFISTDPYNVEVFLKYFNEKPVIKQLTKVSRPGKRIYISVIGLWKASNGLGLNILSTSKGLLSDQEARKLNVGGELLCKVF